MINRSHLEAHARLLRLLQNVQRPALLFLRRERRQPQVRIAALLAVEARKPSLFT